jgi:hypothetical protein
LIFIFLFFLNHKFFSAFWLESLSLEYSPKESSESSPWLEPYLLPAQAGTR